MNDMIIQNTSRYPTRILEPLLQLCLRVTGRNEQFKHKPVTVKITNCSRSFRGRAATTGQHVLLRIGSPKHFPMEPHKYFGYSEKADMPVIPRMKNWIEAFVMLAAHEFEHLREYDHKARQAYERMAELNAIDALDEFAKQRRNILLGIAQQTRRINKKERDQQDRQRIRTEAMNSPQHRLAKLIEKEYKWTRKLKLALTKCKKIRAQRRRLEKKIQMQEHN